MLQLGFQHLIPILPLLAWCLIVGGGFILLARNGFFTPRLLNLRKKGLRLIFAGRPAEAEEIYRRALLNGPMIKASDRVRLLVQLGISLADQEKYAEAADRFNEALRIGDPTGSCQENICDLLLLRRTDLETALDMAEQSIKIGIEKSESSVFGSSWISVWKILWEVRTSARKAQIFALLGKTAEAGREIDNALRLLDESKSKVVVARPTPPLLARVVFGRSRYDKIKRHAIAETHWVVGLGLLGMGQKGKAIEQFKIVQANDRRGKYRNLAEKKLHELERPVP